MIEIDPDNSSERPSGASIRRQNPKEQDASNGPGLVKGKTSGRGRLHRGAYKKPKWRYGRWIVGGLVVAFGVAAAASLFGEGEPDHSTTPIGATFSIQNSFLKIESVLPNLSAQKAGVRAGDVLVLVDNKFPVERMSLYETIKRLQGPSGSSVRLSVRRKGFPDLLEFNLKRSEIATLISTKKEPPISIGRSVRVPFMLDSRFKKREVYVDNKLRNNWSIGGLRKLSGSSITKLHLPIFQRDTAPSGRDARHVQRVFNYGYCGKRKPVSSLRGWKIANMINVCTQSNGAHFSATATNNIHSNVLDFMYYNSSSKDYILFAIRDGRASHDDVVKMQKALNREGFSIQDDGLWRPETTNGLVTFLKLHTNVFLDVSEGYLSKLKGHITDENRGFITKLALSRARIDSPQLKEQNFVLR